MNRKNLQIDFVEYDSIDELLAEDRALMEKAIKAADKAYSPHSHFNVGAAILLDNGESVCGSNQENAAFPSGICAERAAAFYTNATYPDSVMKAIAIVAKTDGRLTAEPTYPCGACRQVLVEYETKGGKAMKVIVGSAGKILVFNSVRCLIPFVFDNLQ